MVDYFKLWITDSEQIARVRANPLCDFEGKFKFNSGDTIHYPADCKWSEFTLELKSPTWLEITGSLHKYWNNGSNENDFTLKDIRLAIANFCNDLNISAEYAHLINLEIGVNINPVFNASEVIEQIICYNNKRPLRPYDGKKAAFYFIEFKHNEHYLKIYDKGKQYETVNTLRIEYKAITSRGINTTGAITLKDLNDKDVLQELGMKLMQFYNGIVFTDSSINCNELTKKEELLLLTMENPNNWVIPKNVKKSTTQLRKENRFKSLIQTKGERKLYAFIRTLIERKINELLNMDCINSLSDYTLKPMQNRTCQTCGKDISHQKGGSKYCRDILVGKVLTHDCRNNSNNLRYKIKKIQSKGVLFDIIPFIVNNNKIQLHGI